MKFEPNDWKGKSKYLTIRTPWLLGFGVLAGVGLMGSLLYDSVLGVVISWIVCMCLQAWAFRTLGSVEPNYRVQIDYTHYLWLIPATMLIVWSERPALTAGGWLIVVNVFLTYLLSRIK